MDFIEAKPQPFGGDLRYGRVAPEPISGAGNHVCASVFVKVTIAPIGARGHGRRLQKEAMPLARTFRRLFLSCPLLLHLIVSAVLLMHLRKSPCSNRDAPVGVVSPAFMAFLRRSSTGSMASFSAGTSSALSTAVASSMWPKPCRPWRRGGLYKHRESRSARYRPCMGPCMILPRPC